MILVIQVRLGLTEAKESELEASPRRPIACFKDRALNVFSAPVT